MSSTFRDFAAIDTFGPMSTAERLRALAARLRTEVATGRWSQAHFEMGEGVDFETMASGNARTVPECGSTLCTAGWAVCMMPPSEISVVDDDWESAACRGLGISYDLGNMLFYWIPQTPADQEVANQLIPEVLELIAEMPEGQRTLDNLRAAVSPEVRGLMSRTGATWV